MATESEAGVKLPPGVGILTKNVVKKRPDLSDMEGFTVEGTCVEYNDIRRKNAMGISPTRPGMAFGHRKEYRTQ